jgi:hypothetical protein
VVLSAACISIPDHLSVRGEPQLAVGLLLDHVGRLLGNHDDGRVGVAGGDGRHDRGVEASVSGRDFLRLETASARVEVACRVSPIMRMAGDRSAPAAGPILNLILSSAMLEGRATPPPAFDLLHMASTLDAAHAKDMPALFAGTDSHGLMDLPKATLRDQD